MPKRKKQFNKKAPQARSRTSLPQFLNVQVLAGVAIIILAVFFAYFPSISGEFLLDDDKLLTDNRLIKAPDGLYRFWCTTEPLDYWPLSNTTLWIEWRLWGMKPTGYHVTNLVLHIIEALLIWLILRKLSIPGAFWAAMIFAVHPVNVESVAWISQRKGLMAMLFFLLSILWYLKADMPAAGGLPPQYLLYRPGAGRRYWLSLLMFVLVMFISPWYWLSLVAFALAMLSKGSVAVLPVLLLGIVWWRRKVTRWDLLRMVPFFVISAVLVRENMWFQTHGTDIVTREANFIQRLLGAGGVVWFYLYKALLPIDLAFIYPQWHIRAGNLLWWLPVVAAVIVTAVLWWYREFWSRPFLFAWGFFCVSLLPVLGFADVGFMKYSLVSDHYQHVAIIGVIALVGAGWGVWQQRVPGPARWAANAVAVVVLVVLTFLTWQQSGPYNNAMILYQATLEKNPDCSIAHNNLGTLLFQAERLPEAMDHYSQALRLDPNYVDAHNNLGYAFYQVGRMQEAIEHLEQTLKLKPDCPEAHNNLGLAFAKTDRLPEAIKQYMLALKYKFDYADAYNNLGVALDDTGRPEESIKYYLQALRLKPDYADGYNNLGVSLVKAGRLQEAISYLTHAIQLKPHYIEAYANLALIYAQTNRPNEALAAAQKALDIARSKGKTEHAKRLENWLNAYRASLSQPQSAPPSSK